MFRKSSRAGLRSIRETKLSFTVDPPISHPIHPAEPKNAPTGFPQNPRQIPEGFAKKEKRGGGTISPFKGRRRGGWFVVDDGRSIRGKGDQGGSGGSEGVCGRRKK
jgi:hypothetical protein